MTIHANNLRFSLKSGRFCLVLISSWLAGFLIGCFFSKSSLFLLMRSAVLQPVSIVGLFVCIFLPLICTYFSFIADKPILVVIVCFMKAVAFGFSGSLLSQTFDTAAWLIRFLFLFSDSCFLVVLFVLWFRRFAGVHTRDVTDFCVCTIVGTGIAIVDYFVISPFLKGLF